MKIPEQFDPIRPFEPDELPDVFDRLLQNEQFCSVLAISTRRAQRGAG